MIVDTSALLAIVFKEPGHEELIQKISEAEYLGIGTPTLAETGIVLTARLGGGGITILARLCQELGLIQMPFGDAHWKEAVDAYERFGRGRHPARLNFGDCLSYATAKLSGQPLLYVGEDFTKTDLQRPGSE
jgi:ribonuclease VapC